MRTREKGYKDYGLTDARAREIILYCREKADRDVIYRAALIAYPAIAEYLTESLKDKMSYDKLYKKYWIPLGRSDFYVYRRFVIALLDGVVPRD